jgi:hypothetical protein
MIKPNTASTESKNTYSRPYIHRADPLTMIAKKGEKKRKTKAPNEAFPRLHTKKD